MNLTDTAFIELLASRQLTIAVESKATVESLRIMLYRKLQAHIAQWDAVGYLSDDLQDATISVKMERGGKIATLSIVKRKPRLQFTILPAGTPDHEEIPAHLEHNQTSQIQHGSSDSDSQGHGTEIDSGSTERESNGQCSPTEDWESELRRFIESDSDTQNQA